MPEQFLNTTKKVSKNKINSKDNKIICCPVSFMVDRTDKFQKSKQKHIKIKTLKKEDQIP